MSTHVLGSSPLARGLRHARPPGLGGCRIIPARAGFTMRTGTTPSPRADHPRSRGVYQEFIAQATQMGGSSPLARGLRLAAPRPSLAARIIPARAGFTDTVECIMDDLRDHPRSRGVYVNAQLFSILIYGSSPLARGLPCVCLGVGVSAGIIPARAGFTRSRTTWRTRSTDHPRSRGVYEGSKGPWSRRWGIIPARAGFTTLSYPSRVFATDHPRSRGVYYA